MISQSKWLKKICQLNLLILLFSFSGCLATVGQFIQDVNIVSVEDEIAAGKQMAEAIVQEMEISDDAQMNQLVKSIGANLVSVLPKQDFDYQFSVVNNETPNAFTIPGGNMYVHSGLIKFASDDSELAGVMAHEIGHAYARHPSKALTRAYGFSLIAGHFFKEQPGKLAQIGLQIAQGGVLSKYGREDEREADDIGYYLLTRTKYANDGLVRFLTKIAKMGSGSGPGFLSSHPPTPERIDRLIALDTETQGSITLGRAFRESL